MGIKHFCDVCRKTVTDTYTDNSYIIQINKEFSVRIIASSSSETYPLVCPECVADAIEGLIIEKESE